MDKKQVVRHLTQMVNTLEKVSHKKDQIKIMNNILELCNVWKEKVQDSMVGEGKCPHKDLIDTSTFADRRMGRKTFLCKECGTEITREELSNENENS